MNEEIVVCVVDGKPEPDIDIEDPECAALVRAINRVYPHSAYCQDILSEAEANPAEPYYMFMACVRFDDNTLSTFQAIDAETYEHSSSLLPTHRMQFSSVLSEDSGSLQEMVSIIERLVLSGRTPMRAS